MTTAAAAKERPILFSSEMVQAILAGTKTQTRRIATQKHLPILDVMSDSYIKNRQGEWQEHCPYFSEHLWVREALRCNDDGHWRYEADNADLLVSPENESAGISWVFHHDQRSYHPARYMPKMFSRILLETTGIHLERVQDITHAAAMREGWPEATPEKIAMAEAMGDGDDAVIDWFANLWDKINAPRGYGWDANPWVWAVEFKRVMA